MRGADLRCSELMHVDVSSGFAWTRPVLGSMREKIICGERW